MRFRADLPDRERNSQMDVKQIGTAVRNARRTQGLRQDQLAGAAGVGLRFIVELEAGKPTIQLGKAIQVLAALGYELSVDGRAVPRP
jgi:HTH-type transcriptional regulator/antitoxin HipB